MLTIENVEIFGYKAAIRGMRNPMNSWSKSDSNADLIGQNDEQLMLALAKAPEERKYSRMIHVQFDVTAPLYWWKEFDTYKVGTVANSTSTMHKLTSKPITIECFEIDDQVSLYDVDAEYNFDIPNSWCQGDDSDNYPLDFINYLEDLRVKYLETKDERYWKELVRWLPESWLQTRTVTMNYENLLAMCSKSQRRFHKLNEWSGSKDDSLDNFISFARDLPYAADFIFLDEQD